MPGSIHANAPSVGRNARAPSENRPRRVGPAGPNVRPHSGSFSTRFRSSLDRRRRNFVGNRRRWLAGPHTSRPEKRAFAAHRLTCRHLAVFSVDRGLVFSFGGAAHQHRQDPINLRHLPFLSHPGNRHRRTAVMLVAVMILSGAAGTVYSVYDLARGRGVLVDSLAPESPLQALNAFARVMRSGELAGDESIPSPTSTRRSRNSAGGN